MSKTVSIITPVGPGGAGYLADTYASIAQQQLPSGWRLEWLVQQDGGDDDVRSALPTDDTRIHFSRNRHGGVAVARNMALARATGDAVKVLDADDQLTPGALARDLSAIEADHDVHWTTSRVLDLLPDGSTAGFDDDPPPGYIGVGDALRHWLSHNHRAPVHPATLCIRTDVLIMLGGWMALPASEDTGLLLALNAVAGGYFVPEVGLIYRKWDGQATASAAHSDPVEKAARLALIERRATRLLNTPSPIRDAVLEASDRC